MGSYVSKVDKEVSAAEKQIKQLVLQLKKGKDPKVVKQIQDLMVRYSRTNLSKLYAEAAQKDADYVVGTFSKINPGI